MSRTTDLRELVRRVDPVRAEEIERWTGSADSRAILDRVLAVAVDSVRVPRLRRRRRVVLLAVAALVLGGGIAGASSYLFGQPAPESVKRDIAGIDRGLPADIRLNPDVRNARAVASTGPSTLYFASLKDGGYCLEISTGAEGGRGAVCVTAAQVEAQPIEVTVPFTDPIRADSPVTIGGRVDVSGAAALDIRYADGTTQGIDLGDDRFFVFDIPADRLEDVHRSAFELEALGIDGTVVGTTQIPPVAPEDRSLNDRMPIYVETISNGDDFTKVLGVKGTVNVGGATNLELHYPNGTVVQIPIATDGSYRYDIPSGHQGDFAKWPGSLMARDVQGDVIATATVASVAWWEARNRGSGP
jgi:hypothetical protein